MAGTLVVGQQVRHVAFRLGASANPEQGVLDAVQADALAKQYLDSGYTIKHVNTLGLQDGAISVFYVFHKGA